MSKLSAHEPPFDLHDLRFFYDYRTSLQDEHLWKEEHEQHLKALRERSPKRTPDTSEPPATA